MMRQRLQSADGRDDDTCDPRCPSRSPDEGQRHRACGDISNALAHLDVPGASGLEGLVFHESSSSGRPTPRRSSASSCRRIEQAGAGGRWRLALAATRPTRWAPSVYRALAAARPVCARSGCRFTFRNARRKSSSSAAERGLAGASEESGGLGSRLAAPRCSPVEYLERIGFWDERTLAVHAVQASGEDLALLAKRGVTLVTCPPSNRGLALARARRGVLTDPVPGWRLAPTACQRRDLNLFSELAALHRIAPGVKPPTCSAARRSRARKRSGSRDHGAIAPRPARRPDRRRGFRPARRMWKNTLCRALSRKGPLDRSGFRLLNRLRTYASSSRISHSVFALPLR